MLKKWLIFIMSTLIFIMLLSSCSSTRLSEQEIVARRSEYPIYTEHPPYLEAVEPPLQDVAAQADTAVYARVVGERETYSVDLSGYLDETLEEKRNQNSLSNSAQFYTYPIEVQEDINDFYASGTKLWITASTELEAFLPAFEEGMEFVAYVKANPQRAVDPYVYFVREGFFYVTDDGYVLSAFEERERNGLSGIKLEDCLAELHTLQSAAK